MPPIHSHTPHMSKHPIHLYAPYPPVHLYVFPYVMGTWRGHLCTPYVLGSLRGYQYICQAFWCLSVHLFALSVHNSHASCSLIIVGCFLVEWMLMGVCYPSCCCSFLCNFHYVASFYYHGYNHYSSSDC